MRDLRQRGGGSPAVGSEVGGRELRRQLVLSLTFSSDCFLVPKGVSNKVGLSDIWGS